MNCFDGDNIYHDTSRVDLGNYTKLHREGRALIQGWFNRAWRAKEAEGARCFEPFIYAWIAVNGWAACVTGQDRDRDYLDSLTKDRVIAETFLQLLQLPDSRFAQQAHQFHTYLPIFEVKELRQRGINRQWRGDRSVVVDGYLSELRRTAGEVLSTGTPSLSATAPYKKAPYRNNSGICFEPECWQQHREAGEAIPLDWAHTLAAIYRVRCNLFHGEKAAHSEMDQKIVGLAFRTLLHFFNESEYIVVDRRNRGNA